MCLNFSVSTESYLHFISFCEFGLVNSFGNEEFWLKHFVLTSSNALLFKEVIGIKVSDISGIYIILQEKENFCVLRKEN